MAFIAHFIKNIIKREFRYLPCIYFIYPWLMCNCSNEGNNERYSKTYIHPNSDSILFLFAYVKNCFHSPIP